MSIIQEIIYESIIEETGGSVIEEITTDSIIEEISSGAVVQEIGGASVIEVITFSTLVEIEQVTSIIEILTGGSSGGGTDTNILNLVAGTALGGQRWVTTDASGEAIYADNTTVSDSNKIVGITLNAVSAGTNVGIRTFGELTDSSFSFTPDEPIWLGITGLSTQTPASSGIVVLVAQALTATKIFIRVQQTIKKAS